MHFNNNPSLTKVLKELLPLCDRIYVVDNSTSAVERRECSQLCETTGAVHIDPGANLGWGAAINFAVRSKEFSQLGDDAIVLVTAHDAKIRNIDVAEVITAFADPVVGAVSATDPAGNAVAFTPSRFFYFVPFQASSAVLVGHMTACFFNLRTLRRIEFDPEYFVYGCESEIFLRMASHGLRTLQLRSFIVANPRTDSSSFLLKPPFQ